MLISDQLPERQFFVNPTFKKYLTRLTKITAFLFLIVIFFFSFLNLFVDDSSANGACCPECQPPELPGCNEPCLCFQCAEGFECTKVGDEWLCRDPDCPDREECDCPTPSPGECNEECNEEMPCTDGLVCSQGVCKNPACPEEEGCECPPTPGKCNEDCSEEDPCIEGLVCSNGVCRNRECLEELDCECKGTPTPTPTPTPPPSEDSGNGEPGEPAGCGAEVPPAPTLLSVTPSSSADLVWTAVSPVTHYAISYGPSSGNYLYGVPNTGNVTAFNVGGLDPAVDYCFAVRAVNDCAPSDLSNEICLGQAQPRGQVLGASTMADTGTGDDLFRIFFIIGSVCLSLALRNYLPLKKEI